MAYKLNPALIIQPVQDQLILLDSKREKYLQLNATGACVMRLLCEHQDHVAVATRMTELYRIDYPTALHDVQRIATVLLAEHVLFKNT